METSLLFDSRERKLRIQARERIGSKRGLSLMGMGTICTVTGAVNGKAVVRHRTVPKGTGIRIDAYARASIGGAEKEPVLGLAAGKSFDLSADGLLSLEVKGSAEATQKMITYQKMPRTAGSVQIKQTIFNVHEDQDMCVTFGYDLKSKGFYASIKENNWTLNKYANGKWSVEYQL